MKILFVSIAYIISICMLLFIFWNFEESNWQIFLLLSNICQFFVDLGIREDKELRFAITRTGLDAF